jgi:outer membrane protein OmpA-like peptidoglycan-associated protein
VSAKLLTICSTCVALSLSSGDVSARVAEQPAEAEPAAAPDPGTDATSDDAVSAEAGGEVSISPELRKPFGAEGDASADGNSSSSGVEGSEPPLSKRLDRPWIKRWAPENNTGEIGVFFGLLFPSSNTELFEPDRDLPRQGQKAFGSVAPDIGLRVGYYPIRFIGLEGEGAVMPTSVEGGGRGTLWSVRGHLVAQLGLWSITPFVLVGGGMLAVNSSRSAVGSDVDQALHFGGGIKAYLNRWTMLRLDVRDVLTPRVGISSGPTNNVELLLGLSITLGREKDRDVAQEPEPEAPAAAPGDRDGDGFLDPDDKCPDLPGVAPDGCPPGDRDMDGFTDDVDACPDEAGVDPDGCPIRDKDGDGFTDDVDKCVDEPENVNGFEDDDGCPDEIPEEIKKFEGTLKGIYFDVSKATVKSKSRSVLDGAASTLNKYPKIRVEISGHTDSTGSRDYNMTLSKDRADAVRAFLVNKGVEESRIETRGAGPDEPIDSNKTRAGRSQNRRIEFRILR